VRRVDGDASGRAGRRHRRSDSARCDALEDAAGGGAILERAGVRDHVHQPRRHLDTPSPRADTALDGRPAETELASGDVNVAEFEREGLAVAIALCSIVTIARTMDESGIQPSIARK